VQAFRFCLSVFAKNLKIGGTLFQQIGVSLFNNVGEALIRHASSDAARVTLPATFAKFGFFAQMSTSFQVKFRSRLGKAAMPSINV
jgi:hypothetical protein